MAGAERTTSVDDPLVRALDGVPVDTPMPWFIRQARKISPTDAVLPMRPVSLRSVASGVDTIPRAKHVLPDALDRTEDRDRHAESPFDPLPIAPAQPAHSPLSATWMSRPWSIPLLIAAFVGAVAMGWLLRGTGPIQQRPAEPPRAAIEATPRVLPPVIPENLDATPQTRAVVKRGEQPRAEAMVTAPPVRPTGTPTPLAERPIASSRSDAPALAAVLRPALPRVGVPRTRIAPVASCSGLGRRGAWLVCTRPKLAALDRTLVRMSAQTLATGDPRAQRRLAKSSARFTARRDRCTTASCIARLYERRLDTVSDYLRDGMKAAAKREARRSRSRSR